jgi:VanZ family protein
MKILATLFTIFILVIIILADTGRLGFLGFVYAFSYGDKVGHFVLYGILAFLILLTVLRSRRFLDPRRAALTLALTLALLIAAEEFSQKYFASRTFSLSDLLFSYAGTTLGAWAAWRSHKKQV